MYLGRKRLSEKHKGWFIDFYVKNFDVYVQLDGIYWHGLDRSLQELVSSPLPRDANILKTYYRDQDRERWFLSHGLRLVRITDEEFLAAHRCGDCSGVISKIEG